MGQHLKPLIEGQIDQKPLLKQMVLAGTHSPEKGCMMLYNFFY